MPTPGDYEDILRLLDGRYTLTDVNIIEGEVESYRVGAKEVHDITAIKQEDLDPAIEQILANRLREKLAEIAEKEANDPRKDFAFWNKGMTLLMYAAFHGAKFAIVPLLEYCNNAGFRMKNLRLEVEDDFRDFQNTAAIDIAMLNSQYIFTTALEYILKKLINSDLTVDVFLSSFRENLEAALDDRNIKSIQVERLSPYIDMPKLKATLESLPQDLSGIKARVVQRPQTTFEDYSYEEYTQINDDQLKKVLKELYKPDNVSAKTGYELIQQITDKLSATSTIQLAWILSHLSNESYPNQVTKNEFLNIVRIYGNEEKVNWFADVKLGNIKIPDRSEVKASEVKGPSDVAVHAGSLAARFANKKVPDQRHFNPADQKTKHEIPASHLIKVDKRR